MKAYAPPDLNAKIDKENENSWANAQVLIKGREAARRLAPLFKRLGFFYETHLYHFGATPILELYVDRMADCEPALALIEDECGVQFNRSYDNPVVRERQFSAPNLGFRLDVRVREDSPHCRTVIVGYEQVPKYEIRCDDDKPVEAAKEPEDDLPF